MNTSFLDELNNTCIIYILLHTRFYPHTFNGVKSYRGNKIGRTDGQTDGHDGGRRVNILSPSVTTDSELTVLNKDL